MDGKIIGCEFKDGTDRDLCKRCPLRADSDACKRVLRQGRRRTFTEEKKEV